MFVHISFRFPVIFQDSSSPEDLHPKQALKISQQPIFPSAPFLLFLSQVTTYPLNLLFSSQGRYGHSLSVVDNGRQLVVCGGWLYNSSCISWRSGQDEWTHYATLR